MKQGLSVEIPYSRETINALVTAGIGRTRIPAENALTNDQIRKDKMFLIDLQSPNRKKNLVSGDTEQCNSQTNKNVSSQ